MIVDSDGYKIDFKDAITAFKFDETDSALPTFHGAPMKAVDVIAEFESAYVFVEIKDYDNPEDWDETTARYRLILFVLGFSFSKSAFPKIIGIAFFPNTY